MWISAILMLLLGAVAAYAGPLEDCEQTQDADRRIHGCTDRILQFPRDAIAFFNRGNAYLSSGDLDRAIADYTRVIEIDPAYSPAYYYRGIANERREQLDRAIADFSKAGEINPRHSAAFHARARVHARGGQLTLAVRDAETAVFLDPFDEEFRATRAHIYEAAGRAQEAIADYRWLLSNNPLMKSAIDGLKRLGAAPLALNAAADAADNVTRNANPRHDAARPRSPQEVECERALHQDPSGYYAGYPCWAREALSRRLRR
jgi:tetratricopeptide (TPR) repeat protein